jgi:hypothetical protein
MKKAQCRYLFSPLLTLVAIIFLPVISLSQEIQIVDSVSRGKSFKYNDKGFVFSTSDGKFELHIASRLQFRFSTPHDMNPINHGDFYTPNTPLFKINRARLKVGGHAYQPWIKYYFEYELSHSTLLDFRVMFEKLDWLNVKFGQWKTEFTRERFISSGDQQMMERSLINRVFTVDRQQGLTVYGHLKEKELADFNYWVAVLTGMGRGETENDDNKFMYFGRLQWNFLGRELPFEGGDLEITQKPTGIFAIAAVTNTSPYTTFSQSGGGSLEGYEDGVSGQYTVNQVQFETAFNYKGFSWASEFHRKKINDNVSSKKTMLGGYYLQMGYFPHQIFSFWPKPLEIAGRFSQYHPDVKIDANNQNEFAVALNWFFAGHKNKLTAEITQFVFNNRILPQESQTRFRVQYDISF